MKKHLTLLLLQIKAAFNCLPRIIMGTLIFAVLIGFVCYSQTLSKKNDADTTKMDVALVLPDDADQYLSLTFNFLSEIDTVKNICSFIKMDKETAFTKLSNDSIDAIILVPDKFIDHIMNGTNTPAKIILPKSGVTSQSALFRTFIDAGSSDLSTAEAGIYAMTDVLKSQRLNTLSSKAEEYLNNTYLAYALDRSIYFNTTSVSTNQGISFAQFYICSGLVLILLFGGITCVGLLSKENPVLSASLKHAGIRAGWLSIFRIMAVSIIFAILLLLAHILACLASIRFPILQPMLPLPGLISIINGLVLIITVFSFVYMIYQLCSHEATGVLMLFIISVGAMFISGGLIPHAMLPDIFVNLSVLMPTTYMLNIGINLISNTISFVNIVFCIGICAGSLIISYAVNLLRRRYA